MFGKKMLIARLIDTTRWNRKSSLPLKIFFPFIIIHLKIYNKYLGKKIKYSK